MNMRIFRYLEEHNLKLKKYEDDFYVFMCTHCWSNEKIMYEVQGNFTCVDCLHNNSFYNNIQKLVKKIERRKLPLMEIRRPIE